MIVTHSIETTHSTVIPGQWFTFVGYIVTLSIEAYQFCLMRLSEQNFPTRLLYTSNTSYSSRLCLSHFITYLDTTEM